LNDARPAGDPALLDVHIERKAYTTASGDRLEVLRDIAFTLQRGEIGVVVGPSGCGKTTMLRIIADLDPDYHGTIIRPAGRIGMVFQEPRILLWRTVDENVRLVAPRAGEAQRAALFDLLGLTAHRSHYPGELSLGLARRVALARAFAIEPDFLILDEPLVSLDKPLAARLRDEIRMLVDSRPVTTLLVTHDVDEAARLGDLILVLSARPARILAEVRPPKPRLARSEDDIASLKADIVKQGGVDPAPPV
jgi:ABC-type nitrate/sulfonate/bicarbonate transport system ATPase subunit